MMHEKCNRVARVNIIRRNRSFFSICTNIFSILNFLKFICKLILRQFYLTNLYPAFNLYNSKVYVSICIFKNCLLLIFTLNKIKDIKQDFCSLGMCLLYVNRIYTYTVFYWLYSITYCLIDNFMLSLCPTSRSFHSQIFVLSIICIFYLCIIDFYQFKVWYAF